MGLLNFEISQNIENAIELTEIEKQKVIYSQYSQQLQNVSSQTDLLKSVIKRNITIEKAKSDANANLLKKIYEANSTL